MSSFFTNSGGSAGDRANIQTQVDAATTAKTLAEAAKTAAELAETNAETAETNAAASATAAAGHASQVQTNLSTTSGYKTDAESAATAAATSATNAAASASAASTTLTNAVVVTGNQTIAGVKTFSATPVFNSGFTFTANSVDELTVSQGTGTNPVLKIAPPVETGTGDVGAGAIGLEMNAADIRMRVDNSYSSGTSTQNNSRLIFDIEGEEHIQNTTLGYKNPALVIQASSSQTGVLSGWISQLGSGDLTISAGVLKLRSKTDDIDTGAAVEGGSDDPVAGDGYLTHASFTGLTLSPDGTVGTKTRLHYGQNYEHNTNVRLEPTVSGIYVESMGDATNRETSFQNTGTIGVANDIDLLSLAANALTVNGTVTSDGLRLGNNESLQTLRTDGSTALTIYTDASFNHTYIDEAGGGNLVIDADAFVVRDKDGGGQNRRIVASSGSSGAVALYYGNIGNADSDAKLHTTATGIDVNGTVTADGVTVGTGDVITVGEYANSADGTSQNLRFYINANGNAYIDHGHDSGGLIVLGRNFNVKNDASEMLIQTTDTTTSLYHNSSANPKLDTTSSGIDVTGTVTADGFTVGTGNNELTITTSNNDTFFKQTTTTGNVFLDANNFVVRDGADQSYRINCGDSDGVVLYGSGSANRVETGSHTEGVLFKTGADGAEATRAEITNSGLNVNGTVTADTATFSSGELSENLVVATTSDNTSASPDIVFEKNSSIAPVATQKIGNILFKAPDANNNATNVTYGKIQVEVTAVDASASTHSGQIDFYPRSEATSTANNETVSMKVGSTDFATDINVTGTVTTDQIHVDAQVLDTNDASSEVTATEMAGYVGQTITFTASTGTTARTVTLPDVVTADVGKRWVLCNAATANITIALNSQKLNILSGASVVNCSNNPHIVAGGVAEIICVAGGTGTDAQPNYIVFGSGVVNN